MIRKKSKVDNPEVYESILIFGAMNGFGVYKALLQQNYRS
jgi:hypothetical protein